MKSFSVSDVSVVVCVKNEESRLEECLISIISNNPGELILVDGDSSDNTVEIASKYTDNIIISKKSTLTKDRQKGIDASNRKMVALVDADHRLNESTIQGLLDDMGIFDLDIVQGGLIAPEGSGFWSSAEGSFWELIHNTVGIRKMIGVAPALYKKKVFSLVQFDDHITSTIEDTDFMYRLSKYSSIKVGVGHTKVVQFHFSTFLNFVQKFIWYGKGDGEFCHKHIERTPSMLFHLIIRYPVLYSFKAILAGRPSVAPFCILQGFMRFYGLTRYILKTASQALYNSIFHKKSL